MNTYAEEVAIYEANLDYDDDNDVAKAKLYKNAILWLLRATPEEAWHGSQRTKESMHLQDELKRVRSWLSTNDPNATRTQSQSRVVYKDLRGFRE